VTVRFEYDAMNRRVARQDGTIWTEYVPDPAGNLLAELARPATAGGTWATNREYAWLDGQPLAQVEYPTGGPVAGYTYYFHLDHLGQPRALTNQNGSTTVWSAVPARPYGDVAEATTPDPINGRTVVTNLRLPGQYDERLLASVGIQGPYYNWNRWYLPTMGRYMELDPIAVGGGFNGAVGPEWYAYAEGNPLTRTDLDGRYWAPPLPPPVWSPVIPCLPWIIPLIPSTTGGDPCENSPGGCVNPSPPTGSKPCQCTCLGPVDPNWNPGDKNHGDRHAGRQPYPTACKDECTFRGFSNSQCN
jgi:RHS repeat-associated protein